MRLIALFIMRRHGRPSIEREFSSPFPELLLLGYARARLGASNLQDRKSPPHKAQSLPPQSLSGEGHRHRLRQRFERGGLDGFAPHEVLELILTLAIPRKDVKQPAKALLARFGSLRGVLDAPAAELRQVPGIGTVAPVALRIIRETATMYLQATAEEAASLVNPEVLHNFWRVRLGGLSHEVFEVAYLDSAYKLLRDGVETLEEGTVDRAAVYPRRAMEAALRRSAAAVVFAHNHPNGDVTPSEQDKVLTRSLVLAATTLQIKVVDHIVVSRDRIFSFRREGLL